MPFTQSKKMTPKQRKEFDPSTFAGKFATKLKSLREKKKLTVQELAEVSGIPLQTLYCWESADRCPVNEQILDLAEALETKPGTLIPGR